MKKITFKRPKEDFNNGISYKVFVGKNMLAKLENGQEKTIEIPTELENMSIKAKIQKWWGSEKIELNSLSEDKTLTIKGRKFLNKKLTILNVFIVALLPFTGPIIFGYGKENSTIKIIGIGLFILILISTVGFLTIGRNKWLSIEKNE